MPVYDYKCPNCNTQFEKNVKMSDYQSDQPCPECSTASSRFVVGAPSLGDPVRLGLKKPDQGFRDILRSIDARTAGSTLKNNSSYI